MATPIHVKVIEAKGLKAADTNGKSDPYYTVSINGVKPFFTSKTIKGTLDPVWNETHALNCKNDQLDSAKIIIGISDWDRLGAHDLLGFIRIDVKDLKGGEPVDKWYDCEGRKPGQKEKGKCHVVCHLNPKGVPFEATKKPVVVQQPMVMPQQQPMVMPQQQPMMMPQQQPMMMPQQQPMMMPQQQPMMMGQQPMMMDPMMMGQQPMMMQPMMMPTQPMVTPTQPVATTHNDSHQSKKDKKKEKKEKKGLGKKLKKAWKSIGGSSS
jgi:hypothetical protein